MASRLVARSSLTDLEPGGGGHTLLAAVAREQDATHFQMLQLRRVWDIDSATDEDLEARGRDFNPDEIEKLGATFAAGSGVFSRSSGADEPVVGADTRETPDGVTASFAFTLGDNGVVASTVIVAWTSGGVAKSMEDDGAGGFTGDGDPGSSTIDYATGAVVLDTTGDIPDDATQITADYTPRRAAATIPAQTVVTQQVSGQKYATAAEVTIAAGGTSSSSVAIVALVAGSDGNTDAETVRGFAPISGVESFVNTTACTGGQPEESDAQYRARMKAYARSLPRGTTDALKFAVLGVSVSGFGRVVAADPVEGVASDRGKVWLYVDDGNGTIEVTDNNVGSPETVITATGGERRIFTAHKPLKQGASVSFVWTPIATGTPVDLIENDDYYLNYATGQLTLVPGGSANIPTTGLAVGDTVTGEYTWYEGLIAEAQRVVDGVRADRVNYPGYRAAGVQVFVVAPTVYQQLLQAVVTVADGYDRDAVLDKVKTALVRHVNGLGLNGDVLIADLIHQAKSVTGVYDIAFTVPTANVVIGEGELARVKPANILLSGS